MRAFRERFRVDELGDFMRGLRDVMTSLKKDRAGSSIDQSPSLYLGFSSLGHCVRAPCMWTVYT